MDRDERRGKIGDGELSRSAHGRRGRMESTPAADAAGCDARPRAGACCGGRDTTGLRGQSRRTVHRQGSTGRIATRGGYGQRRRSGVAPGRQPSQGGQDRGDPEQVQRAGGHLPPRSRSRSPSDIRGAACRRPQEGPQGAGGSGRPAGQGRSGVRHERPHPAGGHRAGRLRGHAGAEVGGGSQGETEQGHRGVRVAGCCR